MYNYKRTTIFILLISFFVSGCATTGNHALKKESEESVSNKIVEGKTTKTEIKELFGSPTETSFTDGGLEIWKYRFTKSSVKASSYVPVVGMFSSGVNGTLKELTILYDESGVVKKYNMSESDMSTNSGLF